MVKEIDLIQLSKDIVISRQRTIDYNERVLNGILSPSEYHKHIKHLKDLQARAIQWRQETNAEYS